MAKSAAAAVAADTEIVVSAMMRSRRSAAFLQYLTRRLCRSPTSWCCYRCRRFDDDADIVAVDVGFDANVSCAADVDFVDADDDADGDDDDVEVAA